MLSKPEPACIVIADIAGYTSYLAGTELDHSQDILADLISTVVSTLRPTFKLSKLEGDAAFVYTIAETLDGSALQDTIERCYFAFRRRLRDIRQASTCECNACLLIPNLDLKFVAHHGQVVRQRIMGREELAGADVIIAHRLLKNSITETLGFEAYAIYTEACAAAMGLADPRSAGMVAHTETYEHLGEVAGWVRDLHAAWRSEEERSRVFVDAKDAAWSLETIMPGSPEIAWEWITSPARRPKWQDGVDTVLEVAPGGRRGVGTTNHCMHGKSAIIEEIVDWRPYDYFTIRFQLPIPGAPKLTMTDTFESFDGGTRHTTRILRPRSLKDRAFLAMGLPMFAPSINVGIRALVALIEADVAARSSVVMGPEPDVPASAGRFIVEPFHAPRVETAVPRSS
jgi:uncharacterized protein YndB with AHSA1/START domain